MQKRLTNSIRNEGKKQNRFAEFENENLRRKSKEFL